MAAHGMKQQVAAAKQSAEIFTKDGGATFDAARQERMRSMAARIDAMQDTAFNVDTEKRSVDDLLASYSANLKPVLEKLHQPAPSSKIFESVQVMSPVEMFKKVSLASVPAIAAAKKGFTIEAEDLELDSIVTPVKPSATVAVQMPAEPVPSRFTTAAARHLPASSKAPPPPIRNHRVVTLDSESGAGIIVDRETMEALSKRTHGVFEAPPTAMTLMARRARSTVRSTMEKASAATGAFIDSILPRRTFAAAMMMFAGSGALLASNEINTQSSAKAPIAMKATPNAGATPAATRAVLEASSRNAAHAAVETEVAPKAAAPVVVTEAKPVAAKRFVAPKKTVKVAAPAAEAEIEAVAPEVPPAAIEPAAPQYREYKVDLMEAMRLSVAGLPLDSARKPVLSSRIDPSTATEGVPTTAPVAMCEVGVEKTHSRPDLVTRGANSAIPASDADQGQVKILRPCPTAAPAP